MTVNTSSLLGWKRETTKGTSLINAVDSTASHFGAYEQTSEWVPPEESIEVAHYHNYNRRAPYLKLGNKNFPLFGITHIPTNMIEDYYFLGYGEDLAVSEITRRDTGEVDSRSIRHEEREGTNHLLQACGCQTVGIEGVLAHDMYEIKTSMMVFQSLEDNGDRSPLTSADQATFPESIETPYLGNPNVTWDVGGAGSESREDINHVIYKAKRNFNYAKTGTTWKTQLFEYDPIEVTFSGVLRDNTIHNAMHDKTEHDVNVTVYKANTSNYKTYKFIDGYVTGYSKVGKAFKGHYKTAITMKFADFEVHGIDEFGANFANWYVNAPP